MAADAPALSPAQRGKIRRLSQPRELSPDEEGGELNIVPFLDIVVNILIFVLATVAVTFTASIETTPPSSGGSGVRQAENKKALNLTVLAVNDGFSIKAAGGNVATGCSGPGAGLAVPKKGSIYDYTTLTECVMRLKKSSPEFEDETQIRLGANNDVDYQTIVSIMDAVRTTPSGDDLFSDVSFTVVE